MSDLGKLAAMIAKSGGQPDSAVANHDVAKSLGEALPLEIAVTTAYIALVIAVLAILSPTIERWLYWDER